MRSLILRTVGGFLECLLALLAVYMLLRGHHAPGGGFVGGLLLAAAIAVRSLAYGPGAARLVLRVDPRTLTGIGLLVIAAAACAALVLGRPLLSPLWGAAAPAIGHLGTVPLFDVGVALTVAGTVLSILLTLDEEGT